jgi:hypothetical protein
MQSDLYLALINKEKVSEKQVAGGLYHPLVFPCPISSY